MSDPLPSTVTKPGILVVDDDPVVRTFVTSSLRRMGFQVWSANGTREALEVYRERGDAIQAVLSDVMMPGGDGPSLLAALRALPSDVPVCFMSGSFGPYSTDELMRLGAAAIFGKPCNFEELGATLLEITGQPRRPTR